MSPLEQLDLHYSIESINRLFSKSSSIDMPEPFPPNSPSLDYPPLQRSDSFYPPILSPSTLTLENRRDSIDANEVCLGRMPSFLVKTQSEDEKMSIELPFEGGGGGGMTGVSEAIGMTGVGEAVCMTGVSESFTMMEATHAPPTPSRSSPPSRTASPARSSPAPRCLLFPKQTRSVPSRTNQRSRTKTQNPRSIHVSGMSSNLKWKRSRTTRRRRRSRITRGKRRRCSCDSTCQCRR